MFSGIVKGGGEGRAVLPASGGGSEAGWLLGGKLKRDEGGREARTELNSKAIVTVCRVQGTCGVCQVTARAW